MVRVAIVLALLALSPSGANAKRVALVVGINQYDNLPRNQQLAKAVNDARSMEVALKSVGFDVIKVEDVGRSAFNQAWQQLLNKVGPGDEVAMFFSGHGVEIEGANYLVPRDVPAVGSGEVRRLKNEALSFDEIRRDLAAQGPKLSLFILDACRDNPFTDTRGRSIGGSKGLVPVQAQEGSFIMFAAGAREMALDRLSDTDGDPNSVYTRKLLPLLKQRGLRLPDMAQRVRRDVRQLASTVGHRQSPAYYDEGADDVCLAGCVKAQQAAPSEVSEADNVDIAWRAVKDTNDIRTLEAFRRQYGAPNRFRDRADPLYDRLAETRIDELKKEQAETAQKAANAAKKKSDDEARVKVEADRQRLAMLQQQEVEAAKKRAEAVDATKPGRIFRDCPDCPEMVVVPAGRFTMGSPASEPDREPYYKGSEDQLAVTIAKPFAVGRYAVTRGEFAAFVAATGHKTDGGCYAFTGTEWTLQSDRNWRSPGFTQNDRHPVVCVNWDDAKAYAAWLSKKTGKIYRLPSEAEREYVARAGTTTPFWWGNSITPQEANYNGTTDPYKGGGSKGEWRKATVPVDTFKANPWGLYSVHGNVWEWTEDCLNDKNAGNPGDGSPRTSGDCSHRVVRGGSWSGSPRSLRSADRGGNSTGSRGGSYGFRLARTLNP
jgi:formylglycine-generating enzyme required for sulfatase activity